MVELLRIFVEVYSDKGLVGSSRKLLSHKLRKEVKMLQDDGLILKKGSALEGGNMPSWFRLIFSVLFNVVFLQASSSPFA